MALIYLVTILCLIICIGYIKINNTYKQWERNGVKGPTPWFLLGNLWTILKKTDSIMTLSTELYYKYPNEKFVGIYLGLSPALVLRDPELIKRVLISDFVSFSDRGFAASTTRDTLSKNLFTEEGDNWRMLRQKLTPLFTTGKLKRMMPLLDDSAAKYLKHLDELANAPLTCEIRKLNMKYTLKCITSLAFGLEVDTFGEDKSEFISMANKIFQPNNRRLVANIVENIVPGLINKLGIRVSRPEVANFFFCLVNRIVKERTGETETRGDFMDLMIELRDQGTLSRGETGAELEVTDAVIAAQALMFYAGGFETSAGSMSFALYELALNPEVQERCHEEAVSVLAQHGNTVSYEALSELPHLSAVLDEALRKHPLGGVLQRRSVTDYVFPGTSLHVKPGTRILIPVLGLHHDPHYFPQPETFDPERFSSHRSDIHDGTYLPFGDGPRNCIGLRLARAMTLCGLAHFLVRFRVTPCERTTRRVRPDPLQITYTSADGLWLTIERR